MNRTEQKQRPTPDPASNKNRTHCEKGPEMQKVIKITEIHFWPISTKKWPKNDPKWPKNDPKWPKN